MENQKREIAEFYRQIFSDTNVKEKIEEKAKRIVNEEDLRELIRAEIMPLMEKFDVNFSEEELLEFEEESLKKLSDKDLANVSGGISMKSALLTGGILSMALLGGISLNASAAKDPPPGQAQSQTANNNQQQNNSNNNQEVHYTQFRRLGNTAGNQARHLLKFLKENNATTKNEMKTLISKLSSVKDVERLSSDAEHLANQVQTLNGKHILTGDFRADDGIPSDDLQLILKLRETFNKNNNNNDSGNNNTQNENDGIGNDNNNNNNNNDNGDNNDNNNTQNENDGIGNDNNNNNNNNGDNNDNNNTQNENDGTGSDNNNTQNENDGTGNNNNNNGDNNGNNNTQNENDGTDNNNNNNNNDNDNDDNNNNNNNNNDNDDNNNNNNNNGNDGNNNDNNNTQNKNDGTGNNDNNNDNNNNKGNEGNDKIGQMKVTTKTVTALVEKIENENALYETDKNLLKQFCDYFTVSNKGSNRGRVIWCDSANPKIANKITLGNKNARILLEATCKLFPPKRYISGNAIECSLFNNKVEGLFEKGENEKEQLKILENFLKELNKKADDIEMLSSKLRERVLDYKERVIDAIKELKGITALLRKEALNETDKNLLKQFCDYFIVLNKKVIWRDSNLNTANKIPLNIEEAITLLKKGGECFPQKYDGKNAIKCSLFNNKFEDLFEEGQNEKEQLKILEKFSEDSHDQIENIKKRKKFPQKLIERMKRYSGGAFYASLDLEKKIKQDEAKAKLEAEKISGWNQETGVLCIESDEDFEKFSKMNNQELRDKGIKHIILGENVTTFKHCKHMAGHLDLNNHSINPDGKPTFVSMEFKSKKPLTYCSKDSTRGCCETPILVFENDGDLERIFVHDIEHANCGPNGITYPTTLIVLGREITEEPFKKITNVRGIHYGGILSHLNSAMIIVDKNNEHLKAENGVITSKDGTIVYGCYNRSENTVEIDVNQLNKLKKIDDQENSKKYEYKPGKIYLLDLLHKYNLVGDTITLDNNNKVVLNFEATSDVVIPDTVKEIFWGAFAGNLDHKERNHINIVLNKLNEGNIKLGKELFLNRENDISITINGNYDSNSKKLIENLSKIYKTLESRAVSLGSNTSVFKFENLQFNPLMNNMRYFTTQNDTRTLLAFDHSSHPSNLKDVPDFRKTKKLTYALIGNRTEFGDNPFVGSENLKLIIYQGNTDPNTSNVKFNNANCKVVVSESYQSDKFGYVNVTKLDEKTINKFIKEIEIASRTLSGEEFDNSVNSVLEKISNIEKQNTTG